MIPQIKKILFTTDLSKQTRHAFNYAVGLASQYGASLTILYVMEDLSPTQGASLQGFIGEERWEELRQIRRAGGAADPDRQEAARARMIREALGEMFAAAREGSRRQAPGAVAEEIVVTQGDAVDCIVQEAEALAGRT